MPFCIRTVATGPLPLSSDDSITVPIAGPVGDAFNSRISACNDIASSRSSTPCPVCADIFTQIVSPPHSSGTILCCDRSPITLSGSAFSLSILFTATIIGTFAD